MTSPKTISVLIPTYNRRDFLEDALASVYAQTVSPTEVIVVNDGSTDDTEACLRRLSRDLSPSLVWRTTENGGAARARNFGLSLATGTYIAFLDSDDVWHPEKLERQLAHFGADPELGLSFTGYEYFFSGFQQHPGRNLTPSVIHHETWDPDPERVLAACLEGAFPIGPMSSVMVRRDILMLLPPFDEEPAVASDLELYLEFLVRRFKMDYLSAPLVKYRWHGENVSRDMGIVWNDLCGIYDRFYAAHTPDLPVHLQARTRSLSAHWHLQTAIDAIRHGDKALARRHIFTAAKTHPLSVRPGWLRMVGIGRAPHGPWPSDSPPEFPG